MPKYGAGGGVLMTKQIYESPLKEFVAWGEKHIGDFSKLSTKDKDVIFKAWITIGGYEIEKGKNK